MARTAVALVAAAALGPVLFGVWMLVSVILQYSNLFSLGIQSGIGRRVPVLIGQGDHAAADHEEAVAVGGLLVTGLAAATVAMGTALVVAEEPDPSVVLLLGLAVLGQQWLLLEQMLLQGHFRFRTAAVATSVNGVTFGVLGILLVGLAVPGLILARSIASGLAFLFGVSRRSLKRPALDARVLRGLIAQGWPIVAAGTAFVLLITADRWFVLWLYGEAAVGQYGLASLTLVGLVTLSRLVAQQYLARTAHAFGSDADAAALTARAWKQGLGSATLTLPVAVVVAAGAVVAIPLLLPEYEPAIPAIVVVCAGASLYSPLSGAVNALGVLGHGRRLLLVHLGCLGLLGVSIVAVSAMGYGTTAVAAATSAVLVTSGVASMWLLRRSSRPGSAAGEPRADETP